MTNKDNKSLQGSKILLVEDDKSIWKTVSESLNSEGFQVLTFKDGLSASDFIGDNTKNNMNSIILEMLLPGLNGLELCRKKNIKINLFIPTNIIYLVILKI